MGVGTPLPPTSPWVWQAVDYLGAQIRITVDFDNSTQALLDATVYRDAACLYRHIYIGLGTDGLPNSTVHSFAVAAGSTVISASQLSKNGLNTLADVTSLQITAGP